jgi:hypothetical protein
MRGDKLDEAVQLVRKALEAEPDNGAYLDSLGWAHFKRGDLAEAEKYLGAAAQRMPQNSEVQDHLGDVFSRSGRVDEAIAAWNNAQWRRRGRSKPCAARRRRARQGAADWRRAPPPVSDWRAPEATGRRLLAVAVLVIVSTSCAPRRIALPQDAGTPMPDVASVHAAVSAACRGIKTFTGELALSGRAGDQRLRGRVIAGFERAGSMRLEGVAPFGPPAFVLAARPGAAVAVAARRARCVIPRAMCWAREWRAAGPRPSAGGLTGCGCQTLLTAGRLHERGWASIDLGDATVFPDQWRMLMRGAAPWEIEHDQWQNGLPGWSVCERWTAGRWTHAGGVAA